MSKKADAKMSQGYMERAPMCAECANLKSTMELPKWMAEENQKSAAAGIEPRWTLEINGVEKSLRCGIGGFAIKKQGYCSSFWMKETKA